MYDNIDDVKAKLVGTFVYYNGEVHIVKDATLMANGESFQLMLSPKGGKMIWVPLSDPALNYTHYNLGYANYGEYAAWWCRMPAKQYQQGLKANQLRYYWTHKDVVYDFNPIFNFSEYNIKMLRGEYPKFDDICPLISSGKVRSAAFHKDFALRWDRIHEDYILDYKGRSVGHVVDKNQFKLMDEFQYLAETIKEVVL